MITCLFVKLLLVGGCASLSLSKAAAAAYWVSPRGTASWTDARSDTPLDGTAAASLATANANAQAGDTVVLRAGIYDGVGIHPQNSGTGDAARIVFRNHDGETVTITNTDFGIRLEKRSYITITGIRFFNVKRFMHIRFSSHHNIVGHCRFDTRHPDSGGWSGALISDNSTHNRVHDSTFHRWAYGNTHMGGGRGGALLDIGRSRPGDEDASYFNLVENSVFAYGGHHTIGVYSKFNVIRNNLTHNEANPAHWGHEGYRSAITEGLHAGFSLYEGNRFAHAGASGLALRSQRNIIRRNVFYRNGSGAIQVVSNSPGADRADNNRIYHNSFYHNGYRPADPDFRGGMYFASWRGQSPVGNVVRNNVFYANRDGHIRYDGGVEPQTVADNWEQNDVNPGFVDLTDAGPADASKPDLRLRSGSAAIDAGAFLTTITSAAGTGTRFTVADAGYFMDGWGIRGVLGDTIQLAGSPRQVRVTRVDYDANTIEVDTALTWTQGQGVALAYEGKAPDLGAYEFGTED